MSRKPIIILITGVPGTGKTTIGDFLQTEKKFTHYDVEKNGVPELKSLDSDSVLTWGFSPDDPNSLKVIHEILKAGGKMIWLDGNREASKKAFIKRADVPLSFYEFQMNKIIKLEGKIYSEFSPKIINPFDISGNFKNKEDIANEIIE